MILSFFSARSRRAPLLGRSVGMTTRDILCRALVVPSRICAELSNLETTRRLISRLATHAWSGRACRCLPRGQYGWLPTR
jgi:hypothetical protein